MTKCFQSPHSLLRCAVICVSLISVLALSACTIAPTVRGTATLDLRKILRESDQARYRASGEFMEKKRWKNSEIYLSAVLATFPIESRARSKENSSRAIIVTLPDSELVRFQDFALSNARTIVAVLVEDEVVALVNMVGIAPQKPIIMIQGFEFSEQWLTRVLGLTAPTQQQRLAAKQKTLQSVPEIQ